ncbi:glycosyltransferase family 2 protein [Pectobacterium fontis]|uniref:Glycosyltransferase n=1 Tax=Pectobacterium fontis TaxID=2558042 RepID=A0A7V8IFS3_9GAMM|nr:hypothetical protein [Pectobacterium fontis]KHN49252.1 hypothetical protein OI69_18470 [Pectobacterium fontis]
MIGNKKVGVGIATYNRPEGLLKLYNSLPFDVIDEIIIVNDGDRQLHFDEIPHLVINNETNLGVGKTKNIALRYLLSKKCEHFFLLEDDIYIKDPAVFERYISVSKATGLQHLNFSQHGNGNKDENKKPRPNLTVSYDEFELPLYGFCVGAFSYYTKRCLDKIGLMDENYFNALEHVDHTIMVYKAGMHTSFGYCPDIPNSWDYIGDDEWSESQSTIHRRDNFNQIASVAMQYFREKHGCSPIDFMEKDQRKVIAMLKGIKAKYSRVNVFFKR